MYSTISSPLFRLILHVNTPITLTYKSKNNHLFHRLTSQTNAAHACIDFSLSDQYMTNELMSLVMDHEKPGFVNQQLLFDRILLESQSNIFLRQEDLIERICSISGSLLDDEQLLPHVKVQNINLKSFQEAMSEAVHFE